MADGRYGGELSPAFAKRYPVADEAWSGEEVWQMANSEDLRTPGA